MEFVRASSLTAALEVKAERPEAVLIAGGTDVMVELNFDRARPDVILDVSHVPELRRWDRSDGHVRVGAGVTYTRLIDELAPDLPALALAARTVGSPQIRNRGTVGGNLGSASPAGDCHPPLLASGAQVEVASVRGRRLVPLEEFFVGPKRHALAPDELITAVLVPPAGGPQQFAKVGPRNAMVIAVCSFALTLDVDARRVGTGIGSAGPTPLRAPQAEAFLQDTLAETGGWEGGQGPGAAALTRFGELVAAAARPIDDVRGSAAYRVHALGVLARRTATWALRALPAWSRGQG
jgi:CO/xanthine dehydrogenase FAD-binding subunit